MINRKKHYVYHIIAEKYRRNLLRPGVEPGVSRLTLYDPGGGGGALKAPPLRFFALTHLILELHYCALVTFPKK